MKTRILSLVTVLILLLTMTATAESSDYSEPVTLSICSMLVEGTDYKSDALMKHFEEKFNVTIEPIALSWADWQERNRIWIASQDMPDVMFWDFNYTDYANYVDQELIRSLPGDLYERYPNLAAALKKTVLADYLQQKDGALNCIPRLVFLDMPAEPMTYHLTTYYRKDIARKLGFEFGPLVTFDEFFRYIQQAMASEGMEGLMSSPNYIMQTFCRAFEPHYDTYEKDDSGAYQWMAAADGTLEGLKLVEKYYGEGLIYKDFFTMKSGTDYTPQFLAGKCLAYVHDGPFGTFSQLYNDWINAYPDVPPEEALGFCNLVVKPDVWRGLVANNFWTVALLSPSMTDVEADRYLAIMDYLATTETQELVHLGFEGRDWRRAPSGEVTLLREKDAAGNYVPIAQLYPSYSIFSMMCVLPDDFSAKDPTMSPNAWKDCQGLYEARAKGDLVYDDFDLLTFSAPLYDKTKLDIPSEFTSLLLKGGGIEENWRAWVESNQPMIQPVLDELNGPK